MELMAMKRKQREQRKRYREKHPEIFREQKRYRKKHPEIIRDQNRRYRQKHREKLTQIKRKKYREAHSVSVSMFYHAVLVRCKRSYICCFLVSLLGG